MPKEITHWTMAELALRKLPTGPLTELLSAHHHLYYLGAVNFDTPYYLTNGPWADTMQEAGVRLHDHNPFPRLRLMLENTPAPNHGALTVFLCGLITHIITDAVFHPPVFYFCGDANSPDPGIADAAGYRHHLFETHLDLYLYDYMPLINFRYMDNSYRHKEISDDLYTRLLSWLYFAKESANLEGIGAALTAHRRLQKRFFNPLFLALSHLINVVTINRYREKTAIFYPRRQADAAPFFSHPIHHLHPVTGEAVTTDLRSLIETVIDECHRVFFILEKQLEVSGRTHYTFAKGIGRTLKQLEKTCPSLKTGLPRFDNPPMTFCDTSIDMPHLLRHPSPALS